MPILSIDILPNKEPFLIKIIPLNERINHEILKKMPKNFSWRCVYLNHVIREPKMTIREWQDNVDSALIDRIIKSINYYLRYTDTNNKQLRTLNYRIDVFGEELDNLVEYSKYHFNEDIEIKIDKIGEYISRFSKEREKLEEHLENLKDDIEVFEVNKNHLEAEKILEGVDDLL